MADDNHAPASEWTIVGQTRPKPVSLLYKLGLAAVALVMVLLPIIYVGIIVLVAWGVYEHALHPRYQLGGGTVALLGYLAPIIVGGVLVFFMIKPLFARRPKDCEPHGVLPGEEPELFRLIYWRKVKRTHRLRFQFEVRDETSSSVWSTQKGLRLFVTTRPGWRRLS